MERHLRRSVDRLIRERPPLSEDQIRRDATATGETWGIDPDTVQRIIEEALATASR